MSSPRRSFLLHKFFACLALLINTMIGGLMWWPLKKTAAIGLEPLGCIFLISATGFLFSLILSPRSLRLFMDRSDLWINFLLSGFAIVLLNWGLILGDAVRVTLFFFLNPIWTVSLCFIFRRKSFRLINILTLVLAMLGAILMLQLNGSATTLPQNTAEWLGLAAGFTFTLDGLRISQQRKISAATRALAMFAGTAVVSGVLFFSLSRTVPWNSFYKLDTFGVLLILTMAAGVFIANLALQFGASRLSPGLASTLELSEIFFTGISVAFLTDANLSWVLLLGGVFILVAATTIFFCDFRSRLKF